MDFRDKLRSLQGETVEIVTGMQVDTGVLVQVSDSTATLLSTGSSGYGDGQTIVYPLDRITYVRVV